MQGFVIDFTSSISLLGCFLTFLTLLASCLKLFNQKLHFFLTNRFFFREKERSHVEILFLQNPSQEEKIQKHLSAMGLDGCVLQDLTVLPGGLRGKKQRLHQGHFGSKDPTKRIHPGFFLKYEAVGKNMEKNQPKLLPSS